MAALLAQLPGPINLRLVLSDLKFADILHDLLTAKGNRSGVPRALAVDRNETRELSGTLHLEGASKDNAIAQIRAINALVTVGTTLTLQSTDATNTVTLNVLPSRGVSQPIDELFEIDGAPVLASCAFSFTCEPYAYGVERTIVNAATYTAPCMVDIDVPGDYPTPLAIIWTPITGSGSITHFAMGLLPDQTTPLEHLFFDSRWSAVSIATGNPAVCTTTGAHGLFTGQPIRILGATTTPATIGTNFLVTVIDTTHFTIPVNITSGGSGQWSPWYDGGIGGVGDAAAYSGYYMSQGDDAWARWQVDDTGLPRGTYRPFMRVGKTTAEATPYVYLEQTGALAEQGFIWPAGGYRLYGWPQSVAAPALRVHPGRTSYFTVGMRAGPNGGAVQWDYLAMLPVSWGWLIFSAYDPVMASNFILDYEGTCFINGVARTADISTGGMSAVGSQSILFLAAPVIEADGPTVTGILTITAIPRYALWR